MQRRVQQVRLPQDARSIAQLHAALALLMPADMNANPKANQAAVVLFGIAGLLLLSIVTRSWFAADDGGIGLLGLEHCGSHGCESQFWFSIPHAPS